MEPKKLEIVRVVDDSRVVFKVPLNLKEMV